MAAAGARRDEARDVALGNSRPRSAENRERSSSMRNLHVAVIGGGIIGAATARQLALSDVDV
ncbi:MAG: hypothetical protein ACI38R_15310, partial [Rhodococcus sp. (in: high G+C Gram-positive bacteria)]